MIRFSSAASLFVAGVVLCGCSVSQTSSGFAPRSVASVYLEDHRNLNVRPAGYEVPGNAYVKPAAQVRDRGPRFAAEGGFSVRSHDGSIRGHVPVYVGPRTFTVSEHHASSAGCVIKGNINRNGERIYHTPRSQWYDRTGVNTSAGERWFCSVEEARAAGWRAPRR